MGYAIDVNGENFESEVMAKSAEKVVLVDFFATWCGPCQVMKPMLERLAGEYDFILAKVDVDRSPELASRYGIEGVPDIRIVSSGEVMPGFVGAISEAQLREMLQKFDLKSELETGLEAIESAAGSGDLKKAKHLFDLLFEKYPDNPELTLKAASFLISVGEIDGAKKLLSTIREDNRQYYSKARALENLCEFRAIAENSGKDELDRLFAEACRHALQEEYEPALSLFLKVVGISRKYRQDGARKAMLTIFELLGDEHPLTPKYRKQLMLQLY